MARLMAWISGRPILSILIVAAITVALAPGVTKLVVDPSAEGMMISDDPEKIYYETTKEIFGDDILISIILTDDDVFTTKNLTAIKEITDDLFDVDGITRVVSLTTVKKIKGDEGFLDTDQLIFDVPEDPEGIAQIKADALANETYINNIVSADARTAAINAYLASRPDDRAFNRKVTEAVQAVIDKRTNNLDAEIYQIGVPILKQTIIDYVAEDNETLGPLSLLIVLGILIVFFRSGTAALLPLMTGGLSIVCTLGFMAYMGYALNPVNAIVPTLLLVIGCTEDIHLLSEYGHELAAGRQKIDAIRNMGVTSGLAILLTSVTTLMGFLTLGISDMQILKEFGISVSVGLALNFLITIFLLPALLHYLPVPKNLADTEKPKSELGQRLTSVMKKLEGGVIAVSKRHRMAVWILTALFAGFMLVGCLTIKVDSDFISFFKTDSSIRADFARVHEQLAGAQTFFVVVDTGIPDGVKSPEFMADMDKLQGHLEEQFDKTVSVADYVKLINRELNDGNRDYYRVPKSADMIAQYLLMVDYDDLNRVVDSDMSKANILVRHNVTGSWRLNQMLADVRAFAEREMSTSPQIRMIGESILINKAADTMTVGQISSLSLAAAVIFIIISLLFVSFKAGILAMIPNIIPVLIVYGIMGWIDIPLSPGTLSVAVIALGLAVDDTIHFMVRFHKEIKTNLDQEASIASTIRHEMRPVFSSSIALALGFSVLVFSQFGPTISFGYLASLAILGALIGDLLITPCLLVAVPLIGSWDLLRTKLNADILQTSILFEDMRLGEVKRIALLGVIEQYDADRYIVRQGERGRAMYLLLSGAAEVTVHNEKGEVVVVERLGEGDIFGEMAFVTGDVRSANVHSKEPIEVLRIDRSSLERVRRRFPRIASKLNFNLSTILSKRLEETTSSLVTKT